MPSLKDKSFPTSRTPQRSKMSLLRRVTTFLTPTQSSANLHAGFSTATTEADLFPPTDPAIDGEQCLHDCSSCTVHYPAKFSIDEDDRLFGHVKDFNVHLLVGTGKTDWVRDVTDEKHSVMQAVGKVGLEMSGKRGKVMLSASNFPSGEECHGPGEEEGTADVMLLPSWKLIEKVPPSQAGALMKEVVERSSTNDTPVGGRRLELNGTPNGHTAAPTTTEQEQVQQDAEQRQEAGQEAEKEQEETPDLSSLHIGGGTAQPPPQGTSEQELQESQPESSLDPAPIPPSISTSFKIRPIPHSYLILMCSQKTRDARCGQSAPLLRKEFERILRPLGLYRDVHDDRPGGVGIYFISHVGGHKYSANVMIYRRQGQKRDGKDADGQKLEDEAVQLIWLARVRPEDCENIVRYTILQGKVVKPKSQLRGGFDREKGVASW
ncbi:putative sucrase/ferredoxin-like family protein [Cladophialophora carrionii]|uniref:Putative sucrase/ferredoxin-like family protein n=1 Tax=Cladophialophora carrionii TaxID=86049 RepID=A0A1C1CIC9_9EURO|nr:putative sucrase/ferredoxin-like family protein [Cladophialophora carrionii]